MYLRVLTNGTSAGGNAAPTLVTDGVPIQQGSPGIPMEEGFVGDTDECDVLLDGQRSAATLTIGASAIYLWFPGSVLANKWFKVLDLNGGATFTQGADNFVRFTERLRAFRGATRVYFQYGALGGTSPRVDLTLVAR